MALSLVVAARVGAAAATTAAKIVVNLIVNVLDGEDKKVSIWFGIKVESTMRYSFRIEYESSLGRANVVRVLMAVW